MNQPFIKFYTRDWQADPELRMCSLEARGLWIELLCIMHNAKRRGYLESPQGLPLDDDQTSRLIGTFKGDLYRCKQELLLHGVPSIEPETGVWFCRRMVKETSKAEKCSEAAKRGGGNPHLKADTEYQIPDTRDHISLKVPFKGDVYTSSGNDEEDQGNGQQKYPKQFEQFWEAYPKKQGKLDALKAWKKSKGRPPVEDLIAAISKAMETDQWIKNGGQFIPMPATWIRQGRWEDKHEIDTSGGLFE